MKDELKEPIRASEVVARVDEEQARRAAAAAAVRSRLARRAALRNMDAIGPSSDDLAGKIDHGLNKRDADQMAAFRKANGR